MSEILIVNRKSNVLGKVIIPRTQVTIRYILDELEELEREEFFRLKKILEVKYRHKKKNQQGEPCSVCIAEDEEERLLAEKYCILCKGPMHPEGQKRELTEEQRKLESVTIAELKQNLSKVLDATAEYEKTLKEKDSVREFKQTTETLKRTLRVPPAFIPNDVDIARLCDLCRDIYDEQVARSKCIVCADPIDIKDVKKLAVIKENKRKLQDELDTLLGVIKQYERQGLQDDKVEEYKVKAAELKVLIDPPIPENVDVNRLCNNCKERMHDEIVSKTSSQGQATPKRSKVSIKEPSEARIKQSKVSIEEPSEATTKQSGSVDSNAPSSGQQSSDLALGVFETEEITEIIQIQNPDGTVSEKRRIITVRRKSGAPNSPGTSSFKDKKSVGHVVVHHKKGLMERFSRDVHSEYAISPLPMADQMVKACVSSDIGFYDEVFESSTSFTRPALQSLHGSQTTAEVELVKSLISSASSPFGNLEEDDDSSNYITAEENPLPPNQPIQSTKF